MKAVRILQFIVLLCVAGYLFLIHNENPNDVLLPFFPSLPTAVTLAIALVLGWLAGWLPARLRVWRLNRSNRRLQAKMSELEANPAYFSEEPSAPVIPDRDATRVPDALRKDEPESETENA